jgi:hypothetical protein
MVGARFPRPLSHPPTANQTTPKITTWQNNAKNLISLPKSALFATCHLPGGKNGKVAGMK